MSIKCCNGCVPPKRHTACWGHCPEYIAEKDAHEKRKTEYYGNAEVRSGLIAQKVASVTKAKRARGT